MENLTVEEHQKILQMELDNMKLTPDERTEIGFEIWTAFYRANIHRFIEDYFGFKGLKTFQKILLYQMATNNQFVYIAARGQGKSYLIAWFIVAYLVLYPNTRCVVASGTFIVKCLVISKSVSAYNRNQPKSVKTSFIWLIPR